MEDRPGASPARWRGLYAIVDPDLCGNRPPEDLAAAILEGGCAVLQLRAKDRPIPSVAALAEELAERCRRAGVPFVVNDHVDVALRVGADGVHLGQDDEPVAAARARLGDRPRIGVSTHDLAQVRRAQVDGADLLGFGPVFPTRSKRRPDPVVGIDGLRTACAASARPVVAIGGIDLAGAIRAASAGAEMVAVIGALAEAPDPAHAAAELHHAVLTALDAVEDSS